jgi:outer membrane protein OmpA-like peptidoglycan-associated protein
VSDRRTHPVPLWRGLAAGLILPLFALPAQVLAAQGLPVTLPAAAQMIGDRAEALGSHPLPTGPWQNGVIPAKQTEGALRQSAWRLPLDGRSTLELLAPLRAQAAAAGFVPVYECDTLACGGFDFRFGTDILPEPQMHVDLGDFRYFAAERPGAMGTEYISLIVSRSAVQGFVQVTQISPASVPEPEVSTSTKSEPLTDLPAGYALQPGVAQVLADLNFAPGKADLLGDAPAIATLRDWLAANPQAQIDLMGHSDSSGDAVRNTALSLARAETVRDQLIATGIAAERITARGLGPAEPIADNATAEGRQKNRRVEVMLTPTR